MYETLLSGEECLLDWDGPGRYSSYTEDEYKTWTKELDGAKP